MNFRRAKRTAYFHIFFNVSGVVAVTALFLPVYMPFIENVVLGRVDPNLQEPGGNFPYMTAGLATVHTVFNLVPPCVPSFCHAYRERTESACH